MRTISFAGRKGGTGKTTSAVNVAGWLATQGRRVLLVDADPQGNASTALGVEADGADVWRLLVRQDPLADLPTKNERGIMLVIQNERPTTGKWAGGGSE